MNLDCLNVGHTQNHRLPHIHDYRSQTSGDIVFSILVVDESSFILEYYVDRIRRVKLLEYTKSTVVEALCYLGFAPALVYKRTEKIEQLLDENIL